MPTKDKKEQSPKTASVSQSLVKKVWDYEYGNYCGLALRDVDILKLAEREPSDAQALGQYFEFKATGQVLRDGSEPAMPVTLRGQPTADAKRADAQAENFRRMIDAKGWEILTTGEVFTHGDVKIVTDALISTPDYEQAILDTKFSGLLGDKWHDMGWTTGTYDKRPGLKIQPLVYKYVFWKEFGIRDMPFYYAIHFSKNDHKYDVWSVDVADFDAAMESVEEHLEMTRRFIQAAIAGDDIFYPRPEIDQCRSCPLFESCMFREEVPVTKSVTIFSVRDENREV
jgi:hypothetical protein